MDMKRHLSKGLFVLICTLVLCPYSVRAEDISITPFSFKNPIQAISASVVSFGSFIENEAINVNNSSALKPVKMPTYASLRSSSEVATVNLSFGASQISNLWNSIVDKGADILEPIFFRHVETLAAPINKVITNSNNNGNDEDDTDAQNNQSSVISSAAPTGGSSSFLRNVQSQINNIFQRVVSLEQSSNSASQPIIQNTYVTNTSSGASYSQPPALSTIINTIEHLTTGVSSQWDTNGSNINFAAGNVGIGSSSPAATLGVAGDGIFTGSLTANTFYGDGSNLTGISAGGPSLWATSSSDIYYTGGYVGVGTSTVDSPLTIVDHATGGVASLHVVNESANPWPSLQALYAPNTPDNTHGASLRFGVSDDYNQMGHIDYFRSSSLPKMTFGFFANDDLMALTADGNLGIGTVNPTARLDVSGGITLHNVGDKYSFFSNGSTPDPAWYTSLESAATANSVLSNSFVLVNQVYGAAGYGYELKNSVGTSLFEVAGDTGNSYLKGNVGIGTTTSAAALAVVGNGNFTGDVTANTFYGDGSNLTGITSFSTSTTRGVFSSSATGLSYATSTGIFSLTSGYNIPLTASTTEWALAAASASSTLLFYTTPSTRITAGTNLVWNGNTLSVSTSTLYSATSTYATNSGLLNSQAASYYIDRTNHTGTQLAATISDFSSTARGLISSSATGLSYANSTGIFSLTSGYNIPLTASTTEWANKISSQWTTTGSDIYYITGNVGIGTTTPSNALTVVGTTTADYLVIGGGTPLPNSIAHFGANVDSYAQLNVQNRNSGVSASSDYVATSDNGNDSKYYIDFGVNSSAYSNASYTIGGANDGYLYTSDGALSLGTASSSANAVLKFHTGGTLAVNERMRITSTGNVGIGTTTPVAKLHVIDTTEVARFGYDASNYGKWAVGSTGVNTLTTGGSGGTWNLVSSASSGVVLNLGSAYTGVGSVYLSVGGGGAASLVAGSITLSSSNGVITLSQSGGNGSAIVTEGTQVVAYRNGTATSTIRNYLTYTSATNYVRSVIGWSATTSNMIFGTENSGAGVARGLEFITASTTRMTIDSNGNIGIGTTTPSAKLAVTGTAGATADVFTIASSTNAKLFTVTSAGNVGIGTSTPDQALVVTGSIRSSALLGGATNLTTDASGNIIRDPSDERLKENIVGIESGDGLAKVLALRAVTFDWKDKDRFGSQNEVGFIAQEVQGVVPEAVSSGGDYLSLSVRPIVAMLVEAVKELNKKMQGVFAWFSLDGTRMNVQGKVCVDDVCVTKEQFKNLLINGGSYSVSNSVPTATPTTTVTTTSTPSDTGNTDENTGTTTETGSSTEEGNSEAVTEVAPQVVPTEVVVSTEASNKGAAPVAAPEATPEPVTAEAPAGN